MLLIMVRWPGGRKPGEELCSGRGPEAAEYAEHRMVCARHVVEDDHAPTLASAG